MRGEGMTESEEIPRWIRLLVEAEGYLEIGLADEATRVLNSLAREDRARREVLGFQVLLHMKEQKWSEAAAVAEHLVQEDPSEPVWWVNLAFSVRRSRSIAEAEEILLRAVDLHPGDITIRYNLACYACVEGRLDEAKERFLKACTAGKGVPEMALTDVDLLALRPWIAEQVET